MKPIKISSIILLFAITGCVSSKSLEKSAENHKKASEYYKSIGQHTAANEESAIAKKNKDDSLGIIAILVDIFNDKD